jgi:hypothetical protein
MFEEKPVCTRREIAEYFGYKSATSAGTNMNSIYQPQTFLAITIRNLEESGNVKIITTKLAKIGKPMTVYYCPRYITQEKAQKYVDEILPYEQEKLRESRRVESLALFRKKRIEAGVPTKSTTSTTKSDSSEKDSSLGGQIGEQEIEDAIMNLVSLLKKFSEKQVGQRIRDLEKKYKELEAQLTYIATNPKKTLFARILGSVD